MAGAERAPTDASELTVGVVASDLAGSTVDHAHPLVAGLVERVVSAGGRVVAAGNERVVADAEAARTRIAEGARDDFDALVDRHADHPARDTRVAADAAAAGLETSLGFVGDEPVREVLDYGERSSLESGLALVDAPSQFEEAATALAAAGAHVVVHLTADGVPAGHPLVPVVKVSGEAATVASLPDDIDVDATSAGPDDLVAQVRGTLAGEPTSAERHGLTAFAITRVGPSM